ncbi:hypothetical protein FGF1_31750 [Flavobacteriaceae bacterium GF1]
MLNFERTFLSLFLLCSLLFSCSNDSETPEDDSNPITDDEPIAVDETPPVIVLPQIPEILEVKTDLRFRIEDESDQVSTSIRLNGVEVFTSTEKDFVFTLNPFDYNIGSTKLEAVSSDFNENENTQTLDFELKKLLLRDPNPVNSLKNGVFVALNDSESKLIAYTKIETLDGVDFFADDSFEEQEMVYTKYSGASSEELDSRLFLTIDSFANILPGTILPSKEEKVMPVGSPYSVKEISVSSNHTPNINSYNAQLLPDGLVDNSYSFNYVEILNDQPDIMFSYPFGVDDIDQYEYLFIEDYDQDTYEVDDFVKLESITSLSIPQGTGVFTLSVDGFYSEEDYQNFRQHRVYYNRLDLSGLSGNTVNIPVIPEFEVFSKELNIDLVGNKTFTTVQKGVDSNFFIPDFDIEDNGDSIIFRGDHDYSTFGFLYQDVFAGQIFVWVYNNSPTDAPLPIPFYGFEFPPEINTILSSQSIPTDVADIKENFRMASTMYKFQSPTDYFSMVFETQDFKNNRGDEYILRYNF